MDIKEDSNTPIILGRPFLATAGAIIDVKRGKLTFEVGEEKIEFILTQFMKAPVVEDSCYMLEVIKENQKGIGKDQNKNSKNLRTSTPPTLKNEDALGECLGTPPEFQKGAPAALTKLKSPIVKQIPPDILKTHSKSNTLQENSILLANLDYSY
jgi:hypothetical protein